MSLSVTTATTADENKATAWARQPVRLWAETIFSNEFDGKHLARVGGITPWMKVAAMAEARGIPLAGHVIPEVHVHLLSAVPNGYLVEYMPRSEPIFKTRLKLEDGHLVAPEAPGLGVELDEAACERYRVQ